MSLLDRVELSAMHYRQLIICTPYIDSFMASRLLAASSALLGYKCTVRVITSADSAEALRACSYLFKRDGSLVLRSGLHAKVYLAIGRRPDATEAIVTSANLTRAGTTRNIEFGLRLSNSTMPGRNLLRQVQSFLAKTAT